MWCRMTCGLCSSCSATQFEIDHCPRADRALLPVALLQCAIRRVLFGAHSLCWLNGRIPRLQVMLSTRQELEWRALYTSSRRSPPPFPHPPSPAGRCHHTVWRLEEAVAEIRRAPESAL